MNLRKIILILLLTFIVGPSTHAAIQVAQAGTTAQQNLRVSQFLQTPMRDMEALLKYDMNWREKWALRIARHKLKRAVKEDPGLAELTLLELTGRAEGGLMIADQRQTPVSATAAFVLGILSIPLLPTFFGGVLAALLAIIFGTIGWRKVSRNRDQYKGKGWAITGILFGLFTLSFVLVFFLTFGA